MSKTNAQAFVARGLEMVRRGRPRKAFVADTSEYAFIDEPIKKHRYRKSTSNPGRYCTNQFCREYVADLDAPCPHCGAKR